MVASTNAAGTMIQTCRGAVERGDELLERAGAAWRPRASRPATAAALTS